MTPSYDCGSMGGVMIGGGVEVGADDWDEDDPHPVRVRVSAMMVSNAFLI